MSITWQWKAVIIGVIAALAFIIKYQHDIIERQQAIETSMVDMKRLQDGIVRSEAKYVTKRDLLDFAKGSDVDLDPIKNDINKLDASLKGISRTLAKTPGLKAEGISSTDISPRTDALTSEEESNPDPFGYQKNVQVLSLKEPFSDNSQVPFGTASFHAWREKPWDLEVYPREYSAVTVLSVNKNGRHFVHNKLMVGVDGKKYVVPIESSEFVEIYPESEFHFSPRLYLGVDGGVYIESVTGEIAPDLQLAVFSYGKTKLTPEWIFLGVGLGYMSQLNTFGLIISPLNYNIATNLPFVENMYIGPTISIDMNGNLGLLGGLRVGL